MIAKRISPPVAELVPYIRESLSNGKKVKIRVTGYSMYPLLRSGADDVILSSCNKVKKYDVVLFERKSGEYIFHRVIKIKNNILTIAGDNETKKEYPVDKERVIAVMDSFVRNGKIHRTSELWYCIYERVWLLIFPFRHVAARILHNTKAFFKNQKR